MMSDKEDPVKPLGKISFFGKGESKQPFPIAGMKWKGLYYFIFVNDLQQLLKINERYKSIRKLKLGIEPLREVKLIGGGNVIGYKPFLYRGEQCICILADHLKQLVKINREYKKLFRQRIRKKPKAKPKKRVVAEPVKKIEEPEALQNLTEKKLAEVKKVEAKKIPKKLVKRVRKPKSVKKIKKRPRKRIRKLKPKPIKPKKIKQVKKPKPRRIVRPKKRIKKARKAKLVPKKKRKVIKPKKVEPAKRTKKILRKIKPRPKKRAVRKKVVRRRIRSQQPKLLKGLKRFFRI